MVCWVPTFFRFLFIGIGVYLVEFWFIKLLGALYLGWLCVAHFLQIGEEDSVKEVKKNRLDGSTVWDVLGNCYLSRINGYCLFG